MFQSKKIRNVNHFFNHSSNEHYFALFLVDRAMGKAKPITQTAKKKMKTQT